MQRVAGALVLGAGAVGAVGAAAYSSVFFVDGGHRAVKFNRIYGVMDKVYGEGMHVLFPWFEKATVYDVRAKPRNIASLTGSKDLQMVNIKLRVLSKPKVSHLADIHRKLGPEYDERVLPSIVNEVLKSVVAQFNASQLITQRDKVSKLIRENLIERARQFNIEMDDVAITHITFSSEFSKAVEAKQVAQQDAQRATFIVERAKQEREQIIVKSQGEAQSAQMVGEAIKNNPGFLQLRRLEAAREIATTLKSSQNTVYLDASSLLLNVADDKTLKESLSTSGPKTK